MAEHQHTDIDEPVIDVVITPTIERDYRRRNALEEMWSNKANEVLANGAFLHRNVCLDFAEEVLLDDADTVDCRDAPKGTANAYRALRRQLLRSIRREESKVTVPDPGPEEALRRQSDGPAVFAVGDAAMLWAPEHDAHGTIVEVIEPLKLRRVEYSQGPYMGTDGKRVAYLTGYVVKSPGTPRWWAEPYRLRELDGLVRHVRLVKG
jgi:hypothetical protein